MPYANGNPTDLWNNTGALAGGGGLISTAADMAKWVAATLGYGDEPLVPVLQSMLDPIPGVAPTKMPNMQMGMAWQLFPPQNGINRPYAFKDGGASGMTSATYLVPSEGWGVTVMANGDSEHTDGVALDLMRELAPTTRRRRRAAVAHCRSARWGPDPSDDDESPAPPWRSRAFVFARWTSLRCRWAARIRSRPRADRAPRRRCG